MSKIYSLTSIIVLLFSLLAGQVGMLAHAVEIDEHPGGVACEQCLSSHALDDQLIKTFTPPVIPGLNTPAELMTNAPYSAHSIQTKARSPPYT